MRLGDAVERALERGFARALGWVPPSPGVTWLARQRSALADAILVRRRAEVEAARAEHAARRVDAEPLSSPLARIAEEMVAELRARLGAEAWRAGLGAGLLAALDAHLPTDAVEYVDRPDFDEAARVRALDLVDTWSRRFGSYARFAGALAPLLGDRATTILDVASGGGGFPLALATAGDGARRLRVIATDSRAEYLAAGRRRAEKRGIANVDFRVLDALRLGAALRPGEVDVVTCTQALHHLGAGGTAVLLDGALGVARRGVLFVDLLRALVVALATSASSLLGGGARGAHLHDALVSARKAFVPEELSLIARCVAGGDRLDAFFLPPGFAVLRTRPDAR